MFKFFRSFRQRLLREGKTKSYLKYAVGEITLVVIGILIALQINLWKEQYNQRQQEIQILKQLQDEFQANLMQLDQKISMRKAMINAGLQLINYCDDHSLIIPDSIDTYLARTMVSPTFDPVTNDLIGSGNLYLLNNTELRGRLSRWTSDLVQVTEEEKAWVEILRGTYVPFLRANYPTRNLNAKKWGGLDVVTTLLLDKEKKELRGISKSKRVPDLEVFFSTLGLDDILSTSVSAAMFANEQSLFLRNNIEEILKLIEEDLKES